MKDNPQAKRETPKGKAMTTDVNLSNITLATLGKGQIAGFSVRLIICRDDQNNEWLCLKADGNKIALGQLDDQRHASLVPAAQTLLQDQTASWINKAISDYTEFNATL